MNDAKLYFSTIQAVTVSAVSEYYLDVKKIKEFGKGSPLYLNIDVVTGFTSAANRPLDIYLCTHTAAPTSAYRIMAVSCNTLVAGAAGTRQITLSTAGKKVKVPLPSMGLKSHVGLHYQEVTALAAGTINAYLSLT